MSLWLIYVRRSYVKAGSPDVSDEQQVASVLGLLPPGDLHEVIADSLAGDGRRKHSGRTDQRDGYRELIRRVQAGGIAGIAVYEIGRLARNARLMLNLKEELERRQLPIIIGAMPNTRFDTAIGRYIFGQLALASQLQADLDAERMVAISRSIYEAGGHRGNDPFGYRSQRVAGRRELVVDEGEAATVAAIFEALASSSFRAVAEDLSASGALRRGRPWTEDGVKDIWRRARLYAGYVVAGRGLEERPGRHRAILDPEVYRGALAGVHSRRNGVRRRSPRRRTYLLAGLLVCACDARLRGQAQAVRGSEWRYYRCPRGHGAVKADLAEAQVLERVRAGVLPPAAIDAAREELRLLLGAPRRTDAQDLRRRLLQRRERLAKRFEWGELDETAYRAERQAVEQQLSAIPDGDKLVRFDAFAQVAVSLSEALHLASPAEVAELLRILIEAVPVHDRVVQVDDIAWSPPARPFFERISMAPPEGLEHRLVMQGPLGWWIT